MKEIGNERYATEWCGNCGKDEFAEYDFSERDGHSIEKELAHQLATRPDVEFDGLVVRRISDDTICLEGVVKTKSDPLDISDYAKALYGVDVVINRLVTRCPCAEEETVCPAEETVTDWR